MLAYNWTQVTFFHLDSDDNEFGAIAETVLVTLRESGVRVQATRTWRSNYIHGYMQNPFDELVDGTYLDTRSEYSLLRICGNKCPELIEVHMFRSQFTSFSGTRMNTSV